MSKKTSTKVKRKRQAIFLPAKEGRHYDMGPITSIFKADNEETDGRYSISEWWLKAKTKGPGAHSHAEDDIFFVIEGTMSILIGKEWVDAPKGSFILIPAGITHDFENRTQRRAGVLNFSVPGGFETSMPSIVDWFKDHPPATTD